MTRPTVVFSHGQESGPWGTKIRSMAECVRGLGCRAESIDYQGIADPTARVAKLVDACDALEVPLVLVGSSMGGHVATAAAAEVGAAGLFVLAPAYYMPGYEDLTPPPPAIPIEIVHGWHDDVVPVENSIRYARACAATLHIVDGDHRLTANIGEINALLERFIVNIEGARHG
ncbi:MAG: alpha/beta fold hydrolase [Gammaproteobacteria bacterium]|nr:alpha/beta fold hydrolase [Gammaproteobacteria bacterium]MDH4253107.1 alpha/beta fold hydrolase [Gammaproteobacteria bacterium]MDH5308933.1 alpha/beta fold hydrolase [Gammaproteobacteria bacterium]